MKLRYIFTALTAAALAFVGCQEEERFLDEVQVSHSIVALPIEGGQVEVLVTANAAWEFSGMPEWLTATPATGAAGETTVVFAAQANDETRDAVFYLNIGEVQQVMNALQMAEKVELPFTSCADVLSANSVGTVYKVKGTITDLTNYDKYGCFYINDGTAQVYVYGSMNPKQFAPEVGDIIEFEGPWTSYGNFDDVTILSLEKSLIKLEKVIPADALPKDGGVATVLLTVKDGDLEIEIPEADKTWLTAGEPESVGGMTSVELTAAANEKGARKTTVTFKVNVDGKDYFSMVEVNQLGAIAEVSVADFLAAPEGTALYKLTGVVKNIANTTYGNFDLVDATGKVYVYGLTSAGTTGSNDKSFASLGLKEGDVVTIIGTRASYNGTAQVGGTAYLVEHVVAATVSTVADFLAQPVAADKWFKLTGTVSNVASDVYGNFDLVDETGTVYVYGLTSSFVTKNDKSYASLGIKEGDVVTLVGTRAAYNGTDQVGGPAYYLSHETPAEGGDDNTGDNPGDEGTETFASNVTFGTVSSAYTDNKVNVNGVENVANLKLATSSKFGEGTVTLPAGTKKVTYYSVAWKGNPSKLEFSVAGTVIGTQEVAANEAAANQAPYNLTVTDSDKYTFTLPAALEAETVVTVKTVETGKRAFIFGVIAE